MGEDAGKDDSSNERISARTPVLAHLYKHLSVSSSLCPIFPQYKEIGENVLSEIWGIGVPHITEL
jgi:hypothetical protein